MIGGRGTPVQCRAPGGTARRAPAPVVLRHDRARHHRRHPRRRLGGPGRRGPGAQPGPEPAVHGHERARPRPGAVGHEVLVPRARRVGAHAAVGAAVAAPCRRIGRRRIRALLGVGSGVGRARAGRHRHAGRSSDARRGRARADRDGRLRRRRGRRDRPVAGHRAPHGHVRRGDVGPAHLDDRGRRAGGAVRRLRRGSTGGAGLARPAPDPRRPAPRPPRRPLRRRPAACRRSSALPGRAPRSPGGPPAQARASCTASPATPASASASSSGCSWPGRCWSRSACSRPSATRLLPAHGCAGDVWCVFGH